MDIMPKHSVHRFFDRLLLGKQYPEVHRAIDRPYFVLGKRHRVLFHTPFEAYLMASMTSSDSKAGLAGLWHILLDEKCSKDKEFKRFMEWAAKQDQRWRRILRREAREQKRLLKKLERMKL